VVKATGEWPTPFALGVAEVMYWWRQEFGGEIEAEALPVQFS
jgi:hypothetical protein